MPGPHLIELELTRAKDPGSAYPTGAGEERYLRRIGLAKYGETELDLFEAGKLVGSLQRPDPSAEDAQRIGALLRDALKRTGWEDEERGLADAVGAGRPVHVTFSSRCAELYHLPWELLALPTNERLYQVRRCVVQYCMPPATPAPRSKIARASDGAHVLFAWSGGENSTVPEAAHRAALIQSGARVTEVKSVTVKALRDALQKARDERRPATVLHLLCHGTVRNGVPTLEWGDAGGPEHVDANQLQELLGPHADTVRLVVLCACLGGASASLDSRMGTFAQALHRGTTAAGGGFEAVVASRFLLSTAGSERFAERFYPMLLQSGLHAAFAAARDAMGRSLDRASLLLYLHRARPEGAARPLRVRWERLEQLWEIVRGSGCLVLEDEVLGYAYGDDPPVGWRWRDEDDDAEPSAGAAVYEVGAALAVHARALVLPLEEVVALYRTCAPPLALREPRFDSACPLVAAVLALGRLGRDLPMLRLARALCEKLQGDAKKAAEAAVEKAFPGELGRSEAPAVPAAPTGPSYALLCIDRVPLTPGSYRAEAWLVLRGTPRNDRLLDACTVTQGDLDGLLATVHAKLATQREDVPRAEISLEILVSPDLLGKSFDQVDVPIEEGVVKPIGREHPVVVRAVARVSEGDSATELVRRWKTFHDIRHEPIAPPVPVWAPDDDACPAGSCVRFEPDRWDAGDLHDAVMDEDDLVVAVLSQDPAGRGSTGALGALVASGVPAVLWVRAVPGADTTKDTAALDAILGGGPMEGLVKRIFAARKDRKAFLRERLGLLWDDPGRAPRERSSRRRRCEVDRERLANLPRRRPNTARRHRPLA